jgi:hypothetical protein
MHLTTTMSAVLALLTRLNLPIRYNSDKWRGFLSSRVVVMRMMVRTKVHTHGHYCCCYYCALPSRRVDMEAESHGGCHLLGCRKGEAMATKSTCDHRGQASGNDEDIVTTLGHTRTLKYRIVRATFVPIVFSICSSTSWFIFLSSINVVRLEIISNRTVPYYWTTLYFDRACISRYEDIRTLRRQVFLSFERY